MMEEKVLRENENKMGKLIYVYDALCPWCYSFTPVVKKLYETYKGKLDLQIISGGLKLQHNMNDTTAAKRTVSRSSYQKIVDRTGISFGDDFFQLVEEENIVMNSMIPAVALAVFRESDPSYHPIEFISELFIYIYMKGSNPSTNEIYKSLAVKFKFDPEVFVKQMNEDHYRQLARYDFALAKQLQAEAFPRLYLQQTDSLFHLISKGYSEYNTVVDIIDRIIGK